MKTDYGFGSGSGFVVQSIDGTFRGVRLRGERSTSADGRVYRIHVQATDACGNVSACSRNVTVQTSPTMPAVDSGQYYDATQVN